MLIAVSLTAWNWLKCDYGQDKNSEWAENKTAFGPYNESQ